MGYDIVAYFQVNQQVIENFIVENGIDRNDDSKDKLIVGFFKSLYPDLKDLHILYLWSEPCSLHEFFDCYGTNFIRDDPRLKNGRYLMRLPPCLKNINHGLQTAENAVEIADAIYEYFREDDNYTCFADWLRTTAKHAIMYELSY